MSLARSVPAIVRNDLRRLLRDQFLTGGAAYIILVAVALRWVIPWVEGELYASSGVDVAPYVPVAVSYFVLVNASVLTGLIGGFLLLEQREERTIRALLVCPPPVGVSLGVVSVLIVLAGTVLAFVEGLIVGRGIPPLGPMAVAAGLCAPTGIVMALALATLADNKVQAFAALKITGVAGLLPVVAWFVPEPWQYLAGLMPPYWACKIWWVAAEGGASWQWMVLPGIGVSAAWIAVLARRFRAVAYT